MLVRVGIRPLGSSVHDVGKQLLTWAFTRNRKISSTPIANEKFGNQSPRDRYERDEISEKLDNLDQNEDFHWKHERDTEFSENDSSPGANSFRNNNRKDSYDRFDGYNRRRNDDRFDNYNRRDGYDRFDNYNRRDGYDRFDNYNRRDGYDRFDNYNRRDGYDRFDNHRRNDGFNRKSSFTNISQNRNIQWDSENLTPFKKNFYNPHSSSLNRSPEEIEEFYKQHQITVKGKDFPSPVFSFDELGLPKEILGSLRALNYTEPTPIQAQGCPIALSGQNMVGVSRTGSGKTLAFILPAVVHVRHQPPLQQGDGPIALVVAPTRELVQQIYQVVNGFRDSCKQITAIAYGGSNRASQAAQLMRGAHICVATPGRLLDFLSTGTTNLKRCTYLVLDEADRMFDMGFEPQVRELIEHIRPDRQVLMWSATWPRQIRNLAGEYLRDYVHITVGSTELTANANIKQIVHVCGEREKTKLLLNILNETKHEERKKTLIFTRTKSRADEISYMLKAKGFRSVSIHGDKTQSFRENALESFRRGRFLYMVATGVVARGLDVRDIEYVINYDFPENIEDYVHRIGRTGRHDASGTAITFFTDADANKADELINILKKSNQEINRELLEFQNGNRRMTSYRRNHWN